MTDSNSPDFGESTSALGLDETSPLQNMLAEMHELHVELLKIGFDRRSASQIVAHIISDSLAYRDGYDNDTEISIEDDEDPFDELEDDD
jgi:hypothetical protein